MKRIYTILLMLIGTLAFFQCSTAKNEVVVYCALDRMYAEPILMEFETESGIKVKAVYDTELTKTVGLVNRIIAETDHPQCDVFWNNEISRTIALQRKGLLSPYQSSSGHDMPSEFRDPDGFWTGFAARGRVIIYNKEKIQEKDLPTSVLDLTDSRWRGKAAMAYPLFGTTATHSAVLFALWGKEDFVSFFNKVKENEIAILDGNATVRDQVVSGKYSWGLTDTDDANGAIEDGKNVGIIYPDQGENGLGTLVIPNTVAVIKNSSNSKNAQKLVDYILRPETERILANSRAAQIPLRTTMEIPGKVMDLKRNKTMVVDYGKVTEKMDSAAILLKEIFVR